MEKLSRHVICDMVVARPVEDLSDEKWLKSFCDSTMEMYGAKLAESNKGKLKSISHRFKPQGATVVGILKESHYHLSTWPEKNHIQLDLNLCGDDVDPMEIFNEFAKAFKAKDIRIRIIERGIYDS